MIIIMKKNEYLIALIRINKYIIAIFIKRNKKGKQDNKLLKVLIIILYLLLILLLCFKIISFIQLCTIILTTIGTFRK
ncbi:hypothetical protein RSJ6_13340 [Clostridium botulinum]|nr:hypothetical protein RSJ6_13340 [Clostridium botulinum]MBN3369073.1 hypothetical protein [Clostridium botulinum]MBN3373841.1 hypothetical protein [Clostridium botulinum]OSA67701.1 hypothetical protein B2H87_17365 [Clostridium botulinum]